MGQRGKTDDFSTSFSLGRRRVIHAISALEGIAFACSRLFGAAFVETPFQPGQDERPIVLRIPTSKES